MKTTQDGHLVSTFLVADASGSILLNLWDEVGVSARPGDILQIRAGFITMFRRCMRLACKVGSVQRVGWFTMAFKENPNMSSVEWHAESGSGHLQPHSNVNN